MNTTKIIQIENDNYLLFHGKSLSIYSITKEKSPEIFNLINRDHDKIQLTFSTVLKDYLDTIPINYNRESNSIMPSILNTLVLPISAGCNLTCPYCFAKTKQGNMAYKDFTKKDIDKLLYLLDKKNPNQDITLVFFGGEPLMRFDIMQYTINQVKHSHPMLKIGYSITTNGTLINQKIIKFFQENKISILLSIDGYENDYNYRKFRNGRHSVSRVLKSIEMLKSSNVPFEVRATVTSNNPFIYETFIFLEKLEVPYLLAFAYESENTAHKELTQYNQESFTRIKNTFEQLLDYYKVCLSSKIPIYNKLIPQFINIFKNRLIQKYECGAGHMYHTVMSDGTMYSCPHLMNNKECTLGNISEWPFNNIENHSFIPVSIDKIDECKNCWAQQLCHGGCASQKHSMGRKANQAYIPEKCKLDKLMYEFLIKVYYEYTKII